MSMGFWCLKDICINYCKSFFSIIVEMKGKQGGRGLVLKENSFSDTHLNEIDMDLRPKGIIIVIIIIIIIDLLKMIEIDNMEV